MTPAEMQDVHAISIHESAHVICNRCLLGDRCSDGIATPGRGLALFTKPASNTIHALARSWSGIIGQSLMNAWTSWDKIPKVALSEKTLDPWCREVLQLHRDCGYDHDLYDSRRHTMDKIVSGCALAFDILSGSLEWLVGLSNQMIVAAQNRDPGMSDHQAIEVFKKEVAQKHYEEKMVEWHKFADELLSLRMPHSRDFPVKPSEFLQRIIADDGEVTEAHRKQASDFAAVVRERGGDAYVFEHDIEDRDEWRDLARDFRQWREQQTL